MKYDQLEAGDLLLRDDGETAWVLAAREGRKATWVRLGEGRTVEGELDAGRVRGYLVLRGRELVHDGSRATEAARLRADAAC